MVDGAARAWRFLPVAIIPLALVLVAVLHSRGSTRSELVQEGIFTPGVRVDMDPNDAQPARTQALRFQSKADVSMGTTGGKDGLVPIPPPPPPTWERGGGVWAYDRDYGVGQRPTTGIWAPKGTLPGGAEPEEEEEEEPAAEEPAAEEPEPAVAAEEAEETARASAPRPLSSAGPPQEVEVQEPSGQVVEMPAPQAAAPQAAAPAEPAAEPAAMAEPAAAEPAAEEQQPEEEEEEEEECGEEGCQSSPVIVNVPNGNSGTVVQQVPVPVPAPASAQLPMEWAAEDAAEHAYNLANWRVKILRAKMEQAKLRKQLMAVTMGGPGSDASGDSESGAGLQAAAAPQNGKSAAELKAVKQSLLTLAQETVGAIKQLKGQMMALRSAACCKEPAAKAEDQSVQLSDENAKLKAKVRAIKEQKQKEVLKLKTKMDDQLDALLTKVTKLIQKKRQ